MSVSPYPEAVPAHNITYEHRDRRELAGEGWMEARAYTRPLIGSTRFLKPFNQIERETRPRV
jgi:hypothetical protein